MQPSERILRYGVVSIFFKTPLTSIRNRYSVRNAPRRIRFQYLRTIARFFSRWYSLCIRPFRVFFCSIGFVFQVLVEFIGSQKEERDFRLVFILSGCKCYFTQKNEYINQRFEIGYLRINKTGLLQ